MTRSSRTTTRVRAPSSEWKEKVQRKVLLYRGTSGFNFERAKELTLKAIEQGYDGVSVYESDQAVLDSRFIDFYHSLRK